MEKNVKLGSICISKGVISTIVGTVCPEVDGVFSLVGNFIEKFGKKILKKGIFVSVEDKNVIVDLNIIVKKGFKIQDVVKSVQSNIKTSVEKMTGLLVESVNVSVVDIWSEKTEEYNSEDSDN